MAGASKRRRPPKPGFGKSRRHQEWPDGFVFVHKPALPITDEQVREIAASLDARDDSEHVAAVLATIPRFDGRETAMAKLPPGDHRARDIETLEALALAMKGLNPNVLAALSRYGVNFSFCEPARAAEGARLAAEDIKRGQQPPRRGAPPMTSRELVLCDLAAIYTEATGRPAKIAVTSESGKTKAGRPTGRFFRFMRAAVAPVPVLAALSDDALAGAVRRTPTRT